MKAKESEADPLSIFNWLATLDPGKHRVAIETADQVAHFTQENWDQVVAFGESLGPEQHVGVFLARIEDQLCRNGKRYQTIMGATRNHGHWLVFSSVRVARWLEGAAQESKARLPAEVCLAQIYSDMVGKRLNPDKIEVSYIPDEVEVAHMKAEYSDLPVDADPVGRSPVARFLRDLHLEWQPDMTLRIGLDEETIILTYEDKDQLEDWTMKRYNARQGFVEVISEVKDANGAPAYLSSMALFRQGAWIDVLPDEAESVLSSLYKSSANVRFRSWEETFPDGLDDSWVHA